jgi:hypothetical protein
MRRWILGLVLVGALALAGCGGSDGDDDSAATTTTPATTDANATPTAGGGATSTAAPATSATPSAPTTAGPPSTVPVFEASLEFCVAARNLDEHGDIVDDAFGGDSTPTLARQEWDKLDLVLDGLVAEAPDAVEGDVATIRQAYADLRGLFEEFDYDTQQLFTAAEGDDELAARLDLTNDPEFAGATERLTAFVARACPS